MAKTIKSERPIDRIETTTDILTDRGGLVFFNRYLFTCGILAILSDRFGFIRKSLKGLPVWQLFQQVLCFFFDGSSRHLTRFDELKRDPGYASALETRPDQLASSHQIKRFFYALGICCWPIFRCILRRLFGWRLQQEKPRVIEITIDTMVMDNDEAQKRQACDPTYKRVKGFQPLHFIWKGFIVDALFRRGKTHSNAAGQVVTELRRLIAYIRANYRPDVTIIVRTDAGLFDQKLFAACDEMGVGFAATGKLYDFVKEQVKGQPTDQWGTLKKDRQIWDYLEFGYRCNTWSKFYRAFYTVPRADETGQIQFEFARPENVVLTNLGVNPKVLAHLTPEEREHWCKPNTIITCHHLRGADELPHRALKDFASQTLPFERFHPNAAFYYLMLIAFFLYEAFKRDTLKDILPITSYPTTVRRLMVDFAAKVCYKARYYVLSVSAAVRDRLKLDLLWQRCQEPVPIPG